ncbi:glycosyltransferase [Arundinibacter roseus]|uniref:Glycosyltransferase subfamily 4-like N-terminal domain-containing protein n=1 Tax=Arundinibacter roseus TaxID=2070510 RepID=A0A4R4JV62_9BACT|nr:glycosyltransferase [Arundinibacter roseus]TDB58647.1 hypothetical protein EZE20_22760 [Arundinibacter roseus]
MQVKEKILYLTLESLEKDPIIQTQVVTLTNSLNDSYDIDILTLENSNYIKNNTKHSNHIFLERKSFLLILINLFIWLMKNSKNYDIIHVRSYSPMFAAVPFSFIKKKPIIFDMRGVMGHEFWARAVVVSSPLQKTKYYLLSLVFRVFENVFLRFSSRIVVVSNSFKQYVLDKGITNKKIAVIPTFSSSKQVHNYSINITFPFPITNYPVFVYSGSLDIWQQFPKTLELFNVILNEIPNAKLLILTLDTINANTIAQEVIPQHSFKVLSAKSKDVPFYLSKCDFGLLLRLPDTVNRVAAPIKFADYLSAGLKVIITEGIGDTSEQVKLHNLGFVLPNLSYSSFKNFVSVNRNFLNTRIERSKNDSTIEQFLEENYRLDQASEKYRLLYQGLLK